MYHGSNKRIKLFVDLSTGSAGGKEAFVNRLNSTPGMSYIDLHFNDATPPSQGDVDGAFYKEPNVGGKEILSTSRTEYWEYCFALAGHPEWSAHTGKALVGFNGILDENASAPDLVHHAVLYAYESDFCRDGESIIWVGGVQFFSEFPSDVGMSFNRFKSFRIQVHYDNPDLVSGLKDNSGVRLWLDANPRLHEAGTIQLGDPAVHLSKPHNVGGLNVRIPPGRSMWEFSCPPQVTSEWHEITVFSQILHMHQIGDMMYLEIKDAEQGAVKRPNAVEYFDFAHQDNTLVQPFKIKPGDELITRCYYNNKGQADVAFGLGSDEEMCIDFITYYPYLEANKEQLASTQYCGFVTSGMFKGTKELNLDDDGMRIFGIDAGAADDPRCDYLNPTNPPALDPKDDAKSESMLSYHLPDYSCPEGFDCIFQNSCPSLSGASCPPGYLCTFPVDSKTSNFVCPNDYDHNAAPTCTGADFDNDQDRDHFVSEMCKEGQYCPDTSTSLNCPQGTYCTEESTKAEPCGGLVACSEGAAFPISLGVLVAALLYVTTYQIIAAWACSTRSASRITPQHVAHAHKDEAEDTVTGLDFNFEGLHLHKFGKDLLQNCSGKIKRGELVAVMGPSGAGKTTFMNVLMGKIQPTSGKVKINGIDGLKFHEISSLTGYVPQSDIMLTDLTVVENLMHAANTRMKATNDYKRHRVETVMKKLGIYHVRDSLIGDDRKRGLSGGERKRVSIALELVANPALLCLDEPSTGLDAASAEVVVDVLRSLASDGHTVICILHQPRAAIFRSFDRVLMLAKGGIPAYMGPPSDCRMFAEACGGACPMGKNPADHLIDLVSGRVSGIQPSVVVDTCKTWNMESNPDLKAKANTGGKVKEAVDPRNVASPIASPLIQCAYNFVRAMRQQMRDFGSTSLYCGLVVVMIASLSTGFSPFIQDGLTGVYRPPIGESLRQFCPPFMKDSCGTVINMGGLEQMLFFFPMALGCIGMIAASRSFGDHAVLVMRREAEVGLSTAALCIGKMAADLVQVIMLALLAMGLWSLMGYPGGQWRWFVLGVGMLWTTYGWGYLVSQICSRDTIMTVCLVVAVVFSAMNGVNPSLVDVNRVPVVNWVWACSYSRWVSEAIYFIFTEHHINSGIDVQHGADALGLFVSEQQLTVDFAILFLHGLVLRLLTGVLIVRQVSKINL